MAINLCLDTNIYLSFYHFSDNDLTRLEEILILIDNKDLQIILPEQIKNEFLRNRENKINDALQKLKTENITFSLPKLIDNYTEKGDLVNLFSQYKDKKKTLLEKLEEDINNHSLKADILINNIFQKAICIPLTESIFQKSKVRYDLGNPPGKNKSYGDAIVWESLLNYGLETEENIDFISIDGDYNCALNRNKLNNFLKIERDSQKTRKELGFYISLNDFFQTYFPNIKINEEYIKNKQIHNFCNSTSFDNTRENIMKIMKIENFSSTQINDIIEASIENNQIYNAHYYSPWIGEKLIEIIEPYEKGINFDKLLAFYEIYDQEIYQDIIYQADSGYYEQEPVIEDYI